MKRLLTTLLLTACSCSHAPISSQTHDLSVIKDAYVAAEAFEPEYCAMHPKCDAVRTAHYNASAALLIAEGELTTKAVADARDKVAAYLAAEQL